MKQYRGYLVDPKEETVTQVTYNGDYKEIYRLIDCKCFTVVRIDGENDLFVDDEGLLNNPRYFFMLDRYPQPLAGKGLILGHDGEGETIGSSLSLEEAKSLITGFRQLSVQGFETKEESGVEIFPNSGIRGFAIKTTPVFGPPDETNE